MNIGMNELGFGLTGALIVFVLQAVLPILRRLFTRAGATTVPPVPRPSIPEVIGPELMPWWLKLIVDSLQQIHNSHSFVISVKPKDE